MANNRRRLHDFLMECFDREGLQTLCFNLGVDYDNLAGERREGKVRDMLLTLGQQKRIDELLTELREVRPLPFEQERMDELFGAFDEEDFGAPEPPPLTWDDVRQICRENSQRFLDSMKAKFDAKVYVERKAIRKDIDTFLREKEARYLVLQGESGMGKTGFLYNLDAALRQREELACLTYDCATQASLAADSSQLDLFERLAQGILPEPDTYALDRLLDRVKGATGFDERHRLVVIVDAINETKHMDRIIEILVNLHRRHRPWVKVIVSCRPQVWKRLAEQTSKLRFPRQYFYSPPGTVRRSVEVRGFNADEAAEAYRKYQREYGFRPECYEKLSPLLQYVLREPLSLWLASRIFGLASHIYGDEIDESIISSDLKAIPAYTDAILTDFYLDDDEDLIEDLIGEPLHFLSGTLPTLMIQRNSCRNVVPASEVGMADQDHRGWFRALCNSYILEETREGHVKFTYERFYDYYFGQHLRKLLVQPKTVLDCREVTAEEESTS